MDELSLPVSRLEELTFRTCEGLADEADHGELEQLILTDPQALAYYTRYARVHAKLRFIHGDAMTPVADAPEDQAVFVEILAEARRLRELHQLEEEADERLARQQRALLAEAQARHAEKLQTQAGPRLIVIPTWLAVVSGVAATVLIGLGVYAVFFAGTTPSAAPIAEQAPPVVEPTEAPVDSPDVETPAPAAEPVRIAKAHNVSWADGRFRNVGDALEGRAYELTEGFVELAYPSGVTMIVQGPARFEPVSEMRIRVDQGLARVHVVPGAEGFTVDTPNGEVVDLGTEFGVDVLDRVTTVQVMTGRVLVQRDQGRVMKALIGGEAAALPADSMTIQPSAPRSELYPATWSLVERGVQCFDKGLRLYTPPPSVRPGDFENNNRVVIFQERAGVVLGRDLPVDISEPGWTRRFPQQNPVAIPAQTRVDSYLVHFDSVGQEQQMVTATATFTFDQPILGLMVTDAQLARSQRLLRAPGVKYPSADNGLEGLEQPQTKPESMDYLHLSKDRKTLVVSVGTNVNLDQLRVITAASDAAQ